MILVAFMFQEMLTLFLPGSYNGDASDMGTMLLEDLT
jgi:hypothetical protein